MKERVAAKNRLVVRFTLLLSAVLFVTLGIYCSWSIVEQQDASERKVLQEARLLVEQMNASWEYVDSVQPIINYDATGRYDFKGVYCSIAGKSIASRFTSRTDCIIRYTRENPRTGSDAPDSFERRALQAFAEGADEYYAVDRYEGQSVFRYAAAIEIASGCLTCHGEPAGEIDETGYPREGMALGDLAGATSLIIPMAQYQEEALGRIVSSVALFGFLVVAIAACVGWGLHRWVMRPLTDLSSVARSIGEGHFVNEIRIPSASAEIATLAEELARMSNQLEFTYSDLENRVADRTAKLSEANRLLAEENEYKSVFLATMTHELRTPLISIVAFTDVWLEEPAKRDPDDVELMRSIRRSSQQLLGTINNTLDAASLEASKLLTDKATTDVYDVVNAVTAVVEPLAREKRLRFESIAEKNIPLVLLDQQVTHKVLINLLGNAVKFTEEGSVLLRVAIDEEASQLVFSVSDTGVGIPEDDLRIVFERFRQADSSISRKYGGSGLGLFLAREMTELMRGTLRVESKVGKGSTFTIMLPFEPVQETTDEDIDS